jgi:hypothetical protein
MRSDDGASPASPSPDSRWPLTSRARAGFGPFDEGRGAAGELPVWCDECSGRRRALKLGVLERAKGDVLTPNPRPLTYRPCLSAMSSGRANLPHPEAGRLYVVFASRW